MSNVSVEFKTSTAKTIESSYGTSKGKETERLHLTFFKEETAYDIAIQSLSTHEQKAIKSGSSLGWFKSRYWKPLTINGRTVLVNINSAVKRFSKMGLTQKEIVDSLNNGSLFAKIKEKQIHLNFKTDQNNQAFSEWAFEWSEHAGINAEEASAIIHYAIANNLTLTQIKERFEKLKNPFEKAIFDYYLKITTNKQEGIKSFLFSIDNNLSTEEMTVLLQLKRSNYSDSQLIELSKTIVENYKEHALKIASHIGNFAYSKKISCDDLLKLLKIIDMRKKISEKYSPKILVPLQAPNPITKALNTAQTLYEQHPNILTDLGIIDDFPSATIELPKVPILHPIKKEALTGRFSEQTIQKVQAFVDRNFESWQRQLKKNAKPIYVRAEDFPGELPRNLHIDSDGSIYILFNRCRLGDKLLGEGAFKKAKEAVNLMTGEVVARLTMTLKNEAHVKMVKNEVKLCYQAKGSPHVVNTYSSKPLRYRRKIRSFTTSTCLEKASFIQQKHASGDMSTINTTPGLPAATREEAILVAHNLIKGLQYLHNLKILHRDLKPANILIQRNSKNKIVGAAIGDLGLAVKFHAREKNLRGSPAFYSPEYCQSKLAGSPKETPDRDVWGLGMSLFLEFRHLVPEWHRAKPPTEGIHNMDQAIHAIAGLKDNWLPEPKDPFAHLVWEMLRPNPKKRIPLSDALEKITVLT